MRASPDLSDREIARRVGVSNKTVSRWHHDADLNQQRTPLSEELYRDELLDHMEVVRLG